ncbi:uncharacterized protein FIBRA_07769 [Fibroporia radiculosa]|uniref:Methionine aminopeptidase n=1 Tax=Fibroporia radiculosa TaxID=599839 RepID=J4I1B6_9APHY|nr:uncharacterized protein FIBRA_07769 [Fibroporia radiculosa]CCM05542.1 predicted protein [Fibroporia radiculosa]
MQRFPGRLFTSASLTSRGCRPLTGICSRCTGSTHLIRGRSVSSSSAESHTEDEDYDFGYYDVILPHEPYVWGVSHIRPRTVPPHITRPSYALDGQNVPSNSHSPHLRLLEPGGENEARLRSAAALASKVLRYAGSLVKIGVTTEEIDTKIHEMILSHSAYPSPLLYKGFPKSCCTSVNNIITHGIPDEFNGDIVNIDVTVYKDGFHGDTSRTFFVGDVDEKGRQLVRVTEEALEVGIAACGPRRPFKSIGKAIFELIRHQPYSVSTQFTGHGIGREFHREPWILHHLNDEPGIMLPGDCFTIEPCIIQGNNPSGWIFPDGWTVSTENCARSAQAEHMVLITDTGAEVLTRGKR